MHYWKPGDETKADWLNEPLAAFRANRPARRAGRGFRSTRGGSTLDRATRRPVWGMLMGASSPYTFTSAIESTAGGAWVSGPRAGTAYEVNGVAGLAGTIQRLYPDGFGGYRFQAPRYGSAGGVTCGPCAVPTSTTLHLTFYYRNATVTGSSGPITLAMTYYATAPSAYTTTNSTIGPGWFTAITAMPSDMWTPGGALLGYYGAQVSCVSTRLMHFNQWTDAAGTNLYPGGCDKTFTVPAVTSCSPFLVNFAPFSAGSCFSGVSLTT